MEQYTNKVSPCGWHWEVWDGKSLIRSNLSNAQSWRLVDKLNNEAVNRSQATAEWSFNKAAHGE